MDNNHTELKAKLFDLTEEKQVLLNNQDVLVSKLDECGEIIEELRNEVYVLTNAFEQRGEMVRDLLRTNSELKQANQKINPYKEQQLIAEIQEEAVEHIINVIRNSFKPATERGFDF